MGRRREGGRVRRRWINTRYGETRGEKESETEKREDRKQRERRGDDGESEDGWMEADRHRVRI